MKTQSSNLLPVPVPVSRILHTETCKLASLVARAQQAQAEGVSNFVQYMLNEDARIQLKRVAVLRNGREESWLN